MTAEERDGGVPEVGAPLRIWSQENDKFPGCGFTRSLGDSVAHTLGVIAKPEIFEHDANVAETQAIVIVSDGITECTCSEQRASFHSP